MAEETYGVSITSGDPPITSNYYNWTNPYTYSYTYTTTVYMYQLICPRCFTPNWGEIDKVIECKGTIGKKSCNAKLKAIRE
jgi:hypothetical protein